LTRKLALSPHAAYIGPMEAQSLTLSPSAAARVAAIASKQAKPAILRLEVEGGGCSGFQYKFGLADAAESDDMIAETDGVRLVVDPVSLELVAGCVVDYVESLGGAAFRVENPNAASGCGCGSSFSV
jgi:iron-sulfur cluster insertion protein